MLNIAALLTPENFDHPVSGIELLETHISWVILTGDYVYKIKKPVNLGFLDFSSLTQRRFYCEEELRLNRRLAPAIYLDVIPIRGTSDAPHVGGDGDIIDYAVRMRQFPQSAQLDRLLQHGNLPAGYLDDIADVVARFHARVDKAPAAMQYGEPEQVWQPVEENFAQIREREHRADILEQLDSLQDWSRRNFADLQAVMRQRKRDGFVRECHGDLHLRNIAWFENAPVIFDCIEFNPALRWIDVISDITFLFMDLIDRRQPALAYRMLNRYLSHTGDYAGLVLLPFYFVYRAMVRAKVNCIRLSQSDLSAQERAVDEQEFAGYLALAQSFIRRRKPSLMITWGLSASGKSTISEGLLAALGAVRLRSDVERKRLVGIDALTRAKSIPGAGIYTAEMSDRTYAHLLRQAQTLLSAGFPVIVDAAFLAAARRKPFAELARQLQVPFVILQCVASASCLRQRICQRADDASDADLAILENQLRQFTPLAAEELPDTITIDTEQAVDIAKLAQHVRAHAEDVTNA
ncbi:MAG: AAA family ATPase [Gammaproteobacteria bacterium]|nr:AAA family ATPase [Gammaproteobacteria bacterium]